MQKIETAARAIINLAGTIWKGNELNSVMFKGLDRQGEWKLTNGSGLIKDVGDKGSYFRIFRIDSDQIKMFKEIAGLGEVGISISMKSDAAEIVYTYPGNQMPSPEEFTEDELGEVLFSLVAQLALHLQSVPQVIFGNYKKI